MSVLQYSSSSRVHCTFFIRLFVVHFDVGKVAMATKTVPDSIILYYVSRCWCNTVSVEM